MSLMDPIDFGPLESLVSDDTVTAIMVNGPNNVFVEQEGQIVRSSLTFESSGHLRQLVERMVQSVGIDLDRTSPLIEILLPDHTLIHIVPPPYADDIALAIHKRILTPLSVQDLVRFETASVDAFEFLRACVITKINIVIIGGREAGKTTLLNVLGNFIPHDERIITIENHRELQLLHENCISMTMQVPRTGSPISQVTVRDLVAHSLHMLPHHLILGECLGGEAFDIVQALYRGMDGFLTTMNADSPGDAIQKLEVMSQLAQEDISRQVIREQIAKAMDCIVQIERLRDGSRRITRITEVRATDDGAISLSDIYEFKVTGFEAGKVVGRLQQTGFRPYFIDIFEAAGIVLPPTVFSTPIRKDELPDTEP